VRTLLVLAPLLAGCGRLAFDPTDPTTEFGAGCVVGLPMNEPTWTGQAGEVLDSCGGDNRGTAVQGAQPVDDAVRGRAGAFPVPSGCVQIADAPALHATTALTLSAWVYPTTLDGINPYGVIAKRTDFTMDDAEYTMFVWTDNTVWIDLDSRNDRDHGTRPLRNGQWQQITMVYDGALPIPQRVKIYVDGELDAMLRETSASLTPYPSSLSIGCLPELPATKPQIALGGRIDDAGIWTRAFSAAEVTAWYQATQH
jgi:MSHA biogenesis protein MshQ